MPNAGSLLYVTTVSSTIGTFLRPYAVHLRALGWRVDAAASGAVEEAGLRGSFDRLHELPLSRSVLDVAGMQRGAQEIARIIRETRPDIVHAHTPIAAMVSRVAIRRLLPAERPQVAYTAHGFHFHRGGHPVTNALFLLAERVAGRWTDRLVVINAEDQEAARKHRIVSSGRLVRMPGIGLDTRSYWTPRLLPPSEDVRREASIPAGVPLFVCVGELNRNKRQADAVEALAAMRSREAYLVLLGDGRQRADIESLARRRDVADRVRLVGFTEDVRPLVGAATALLATSKREGLNRSIMEALALEVPVIATTARGNRELVEDAGFVVDVGDSAAMAAAMDWLVDHPDEGRAMGLRGRARIVERYDLELVVERHVSMYREMLVDRARRKGL
jgi:glycosyltransferase involved in cell wall biosynthesis